VLVRAISRAIHADTATLLAIADDTGRLILWYSPKSAVPTLMLIFWHWNGPSPIFGGTVTTNYSSMNKHLLVSPKINYS
jgi:hypothetical protein